MKRFASILILLLAITFALPALAKAGLYTVVTIKKGIAVTSCIQNPQVQVGSMIRLYQYGKMERAVKVVKVARDDANCKQFYLDITNLGNGMYLGVWDKNPGSVKQIPENGRMTYLARKDAQKNIQGIVKTSPKFKIMLKQKKVLAFSYQDKIFGVAQYEFVNRGTKKVEIGLFVVEVSPTPRVVFDEKFAGRIGEIPTHFTFDFIDDNGDGLPELAILRGKLSKAQGKYAGEIQIYQYSGDRFVLSKTEPFTFPY